MVIVVPPVADVLVPPDPRLIEFLICDRSPDLRGLRINGVIVPVIPLAAFNVGAQVVEVIDLTPIRVSMPFGITPIRQRHVVVDTDEIDVVVCPKRIEVKIPVPAAILRLISEILAPIGSIADLGVRPHDRAHLCCKGDQSLNKYKAVGLSPDLGETAQFRSDAERFHAACCGAQGGIVQDEPGK